MLIRHRLILWFVFFVTLVLLSFSLFIYFTYARHRNTFFQQRLERRVLGTQQLFDPAGELKGSINTVLNEQSDMVFSGKDSLYYSHMQTFDFVPSPAFLDSVRHEGKLFFSYPVKGREYPKDGVAMAYRVSFQPDDEAPYVAIITAYDSEGLQRQKSLGELLVFANIVCIGLVGFFAHIFSIRALRPLNALIDQIKGRFNHTLSFRLRNLTPNDEVGSLTTSFNELLDQQERLIANQRAFISQASHELRTPMATLKGLLETALYYDKDEASLRESQKKAVQELDRLISLSNGLLMLASVENQENYVHRQKVDLMELLMDSMEQVQAKWADQKISLNFSDGVTMQDRPLEIPGEHSLLKAAITNLIDNACKYSGHHDVQISLEMNTETRLRLVISDQGIGIPEEELQQVFEPLFRGSNATSRQGFGIGLTLARRIILLHRGEIKIASEVNRGTEITIDFLFPYDLPAVGSRD
ncbi:HAMP domain-containing sensor histidine kinase [Ravibacter arvi]|uniref:histidine kinase n=1 Tax=Ravibacter arvi TaxID=2051041 RepID=A0ABP8LLS7_9BACT